MTWSSKTMPTMTALSLLAVLFGAHAAASEVMGAFSQSFVEDRYDEVSPAVCLLSYTAEITNPQTGKISKRAKRALGLIVAPDGLLMTHGHFQLENSEPFNITVTVGHGEKEKEYGARLLEKPDNINVCFLQMEDDDPLDLPCVRFKKDAQLGVGEPVMLLGVMGESLDFQSNVFVRRVGAVLEQPRTTYCIDDRVPFGAVGGPVLNAQGEVVGVVGFDLSPNEGGDLYIRSGHPLIYQSGLFQEYIETPPDEQAEDEGKEESWLGVFTQPLTDDLAEYWGVPNKGGIVVSGLLPESPAAAGGLQRGDIIVSFNEVPVRAKLDREVLAFTKLVRETAVGTEAAIKILREGEPQTVTITLGVRPKSSREAIEFTDEVFGLTVREITRDLRTALNLGEDVQGVIVRRVKSGSWANLAGFRPGVIILNFGDHPVTSVEDFEAAVKKIAEAKPAEVTVFCRVGARTGFFRIQPRWER